MLLVRNVSELVTGQFHSATQLSLAPCIGKINTIMELKAEELELISAHSILGRDILAQIKRNVSERMSFI